MNRVAHKMSIRSKLFVFSLTLQLFYKNVETLYLNKHHAMKDGEVEV